MLAGLVAGSAAPARAGFLLRDEFGDSALDPAWTVTLQDADGWTAAETGGWLQVSDLDPTMVNAGSGGPWAKAYLCRSVPATGDFAFEARLAWNAEGSDAAMQNVLAWLMTGPGLPAADNWLAFAGAHDPWLTHTGQYWLGTPSQDVDSGYDSLSAAGSATIAVSRVGKTLQISWNGNPLITEVNEAPLVGVCLEFAHYAYDAGGVQSLFGTERVDYVRLVPEPGTLALLLAGVAALVARRRG